MGGLGADDIFVARVDGNSKVRAVGTTGKRSVMLACTVALSMNDPNGLEALWKMLRQYKLHKEYYEMLDLVDANSTEYYAKAGKSSKDEWSGSKRKREDKDADWSSKSTSNAKSSSGDKYARSGGDHAGRSDDRYAKTSGDDRYAKSSRDDKYANSGSDDKYAKSSSEDKWTSKSDSNSNWKAGGDDNHGKPSSDDKWTPKPSSDDKWTPKPSSDDNWTPKAGPLRVRVEQFASTASELNSQLEAYFA